MLDFWSKYKITTGMVFSGLAKAFLDNYWVFTKTPLSEGNGSDEGKTFYMLGQIIFTVVLYGGVGYLIDLARAPRNRQEENIPLLPQYL